MRSKCRAPEKQCRPASIDQDGELNALTFPLLALGVGSREKFDDCEFIMNLTLSSPDSELTISRELKTFDGALPIVTPTGDLVTVIEVDRSISRAGDCRCGSGSPLSFLCSSW